MYRYLDIFKSGGKFGGNGRPLLIDSSDLRILIAWIDDCQETKAVCDDEALTQKILELSRLGLERRNKSGVFLSSVSHNTVLRIRNRICASKVKAQTKTAARVHEENDIRNFITNAV